jgi:hypothetical protein
MLVIYEHLNILAMFCYNLHPAQPEEDWPPLIAWLLSRFLPRVVTGSGSRTEKRKRKTKNEKVIFFRRNRTENESNLLGSGTEPLFSNLENW